MLVNSMDFKLTEEQFNIIRSGLLELPAKLSLNVLADLNRQKNSNLDPTGTDELKVKEKK